MSKRSSTNPSPSLWAASRTKDAASAIAEQEEEIDGLVLTLRSHHVARLNKLECSPEVGMIFVDILTDLERVSDHATNIMYAVYDRDRVDRIG